MEPIHLTLHRELSVGVLGTNKDLQRSPINLSQQRRTKEATFDFLVVLCISHLQIHTRGLNTGKESASVRSNKKKKSKYSSLGQHFSYSYKGLKSSRNKWFSWRKGHCFSSLIITSQIGKALSPLFCPGFSTHEKRETRTRKRAKEGCGQGLARLLPLQLCQSPSPQPWP